MTKKLLVLFVLISLTLLPASAAYQNRQQARSGLSLSFSLGYATGLDDFLTAYSYTWGDYDYDITEEGSIESLFYNNRLSGAISLDLRVHRHFGFSVSGAFVRQLADIYSDYNMNILWWDNTQTNLPGEGLEFGSIEVFPLSLNLFLNARLGYGFMIKLYGGITLFLVDYDLFSQVGWGEMFEDAFYYYPDWFAIDVEVYGPDQILGGNIGIDLEKRYNRAFGMIFGIQYFFAPVVEYLWSVVPRTVWESEYENGELFTAPDIHVAGDITAPVDLSFLRIYLGMKFYL
jgi:hypothetical protein